MMKKDDFMDAMGGLDREFLLETEHARYRRGKKRQIAGILGIAAAALLLIGGSAFLIRKNIISKGSAAVQPEESTSAESAETGQEEGPYYTGTMATAEPPQSTTEAENAEAVQTPDAESGELTESTGPEEETPDRFGYTGLYDSRICYIHGNEPDFTEGVSVRETLLYTAPCESIYETGKIYPGRLMVIISKVQVGTYDEYDSLTEDEWYLVSTGDLQNIGYVRKEDVADAAETSVEASQPWQVKAGAVYYADRSCSTPLKEDYPVGPLWGSVNPDVEDHVWKFDGLSGLQVYINDLDAIEPNPNPGQQRNGRAG